MTYSFRLAHDVWIVDDGPGLIALGGAPPKYLRLPPKLSALLTWLANYPMGVTEADVRRSSHGLEQLDILASAGLVVKIPAEGLPVPPQIVRRWLVAQMKAHAAIRLHGWEAISSRMEATGIGRIPHVRPLVFDEIEAAARMTASYPGTTRKCTHVALAATMVLLTAGFDAHISVRVAPSNSFMHAQAQVGQHVIDPNDSLAEAPPLRLLDTSDGRVVPSGAPRTLDTIRSQWPSS